MTRTPDFNTEKLNELYERKSRLLKRQRALAELNDTPASIEARKDVEVKLTEVDAEIDAMDDL